MRSILRRGAERYLDGEMTMGEWEQGLVMAYADSLWLFGIALFLCMGTVFLLRKPGSGAVTMAH